MTRMRTLLRALPYFGAAAVVVLSLALVATIFFTQNQLPWQAFLAGALVAATAALASRISSVASTVHRLRSELDAARSEVASEGVLRGRAEAELDRVKGPATYLDELMPAMIAYMDLEYRIRFHNRAYGTWASGTGARLEGQALAEVFGQGAFVAIKPRLDAALAGHVVRYEHDHRVPGGSPSTVNAQYLPRFAANGKVTGVFLLFVEITRRDHFSGAALSNPPDGNGQALYADTLATELTQWRDVAERLASALANDEFILYSQSISALDPQKTPRAFHEILLRLQEEEDNLMPPGAFLPLAEKHGLMPDVDSWVIQHLLEWADLQAERRTATYSINLSAPALADPAFVKSLRALLEARRGAGPELCFEIAERDASQSVDNTLAFMLVFKPLGCRFALCGIGQAPVSLGLLKRLPVDYVKIDGGLIVGMLRNAVDAARVKAIARVALSLGVATIAECVEDDATIAALRALGIDYAQGFAVSRPAPLVQAPAALGRVYATMS